MATLGDLKARIADEILKRNLTSQIAQHIARAIEHFADRRFWFNEARFTGDTTAGDAYVALPTELRRIDMLSITVGGSAYELVSRDWTTIEDWQGMAASGQPTDYALSGAQIRLYPTPTAIYPLALLGVADLPALSTDASSNAWTNEAADLIAARTRMTLFRDVLRDAEGVGLAKDAIQEAEQALDRKTTMRIGQGEVRPHL
jgi:hypothetical protein